MFYALNSQGQLIHVSAATASHKYYCPLCHSLVKIRKGQTYSCHFAHLNCEHSKGHSETEIHQAGKELIAKWGSEMNFHSQTEVYLKNIKRRADVLMNNANRKIIVEYQCSPITPKELTKRTRAYRKVNLKCIWIVGKRYKIKNRISQKIAQFFRFHPNIGFYYLYLNVEFQRLELIYQIKKADFLPVQYRIKYLNNFNELIYFIKNANENYLGKISQQQRIRQLKRLQRSEMQLSGIIHELQIHCYKQRLNFHQLALQKSSTSYEYPIYPYSKLVYLIAKEVNYQKKSTIYQMPFVNWQNFI